MVHPLSNRSEEVTERTNIVDVFSPILEISPEEGLGLVLQGIVAKGEEYGIPIYLDLRDANGDPLPTDTSVGLQFIAPGDDDRTTISHKLTNIRPYRTLTINEQQNVENIDQVKHVLKGTEAATENGEMPRVGIDHTATAFLSIESSTQVNWSQSAAYIDRTAVKQVS